MRHLRRCGTPRPRHRRSRDAGRASLRAGGRLGSSAASAQDDRIDLGDGVSKFLEGAGSGLSRLVPVTDNDCVTNHVAMSRIGSLHGNLVAAVCGIASVLALAACDSGHVVTFDNTTAATITLYRDGTK